MERVSRHRLLSRENGKLPDVPDGSANHGCGVLRLERNAITVNSVQDLILYFTAGQRTPNATVKIYLPAGIDVRMDNTTVNVIGRGDVKLKDLATQSMGRLGTNYPFRKVGTTAITKSPDGGSVLLFRHLDPTANGAI